MESDSARIHLARDLHHFDQPVDEEGSPAIPEGEPDPASASPAPHAGGRLWRDGGKVLYQDETMPEAKAVRVVWARPLSDRSGPVSILMAEKKKEVAYIPDLRELPAESRRIAVEELGVNVVMPVIREIRRVNPRFGNFYWDVDTNMGRRTFLLLSPETNAYRTGPDAIVLRDVSGNCYEIASEAALSSASKRELDKVL